MAISRRVFALPWTSLLLWLLLLTPLLGSCTSVRAVVKIGLLAPFEGVERRTGYRALTAMRLAINETSGGVAIIPLALDEGPDPATAARATQKLLLASEVNAVVGPMTPALLDAVGAVVTAHPLPWYVPFAPPPDRHPAGTAALQEQTWLVPLIHAVAALEQQRGQQRLVLAGGSAAWLDDVALDSVVPLPILRSAELASVDEHDAVFWLGSAVEGAHYLCQLRTRQPAVPFWLGVQGDNPLLTELCQITDGVSLVTWLDDGYADWAQAHALPSPFAYLVYRATVQAVAQINGAALPGVPAWRITYFTIQPDGSSVLDNAVVLNPQTRAGETGQ